MRIKLTLTQKQFISNILSDKALLQEEFKRLTQREQELVVTIVESAGGTIPNGSQVIIEGDELVIPEKAESTDKPVKLKKTKNEQSTKAKS